MGDALFLLIVFAIVIFFVAGFPGYLIMKSFSQKQSQPIRNQDNEITEEIKKAWQIIISFSKLSQECDPSNLPLSEISKACGCLKYLKKCAQAGYKTGQPPEYYEEQIGLLESTKVDVLLNKENYDVTIEEIDERHSYCDLIRVHIKNRDGISRQDRLKTCKQGDRLVLKPDPYDEDRDDSIGVFTLAGHQIGNLSSSDCKWLYPMLEKEFDPKVYITYIKKNFEKGNKLECLIEVKLPEPSSK